ncbi:MAG: CRISPR-associated protein Csx14 [Nitrososphaeria archaeon]
MSIIATIGTSPPVITEFLQYVKEVLDQRVTDLTIITTKEPLVLEGLELVKAGVADRYPMVHLHVVGLPFDDVDSEERNTEFIGIAARILRDQKEKYGIEVVHLCVAGGRKEVCIMLSLLAQFYNVNGVYHIVMPDVKTFNQQLELIRYETRELANAEDKLAYYRQKKELLEPVLFPQPSTYNVIKIPVIPYPMHTLIGMKQVLKQRKFPLKSIDTDIASQLRDFGYIRIIRNYAYTSPDGERLLRFIGSVAN